MSDPKPDEAEIVALARIKARWGDVSAITEADLRDAREFIAMADALLKCRLAQQGPKGLAP